MGVTPLDSAFGGSNSFGHDHFSGVIYQPFTLIVRVHRGLNVTLFVLPQCICLFMRGGNHATGNRHSRMHILSF
jgi:hypothetical protein